MAPLPYHALRTPLGEIRVYVQGNIPALIVLPGSGRAGVPSALPPPPEVREALQALEGYFRGREVPDSLALKLLDSMRPSPFAAAVLGEVIRIPRGRTLSYGEVAARAGSPGAARAAGNILARNPFPIIIPCHRVIRGNGTPGGFRGGQNLKVRLLRAEGALP